MQKFFFYILVALITKPSNILFNTRLLRSDCGRVGFLFVEFHVTRLFYENCFHAVYIFSVINSILYKLG